MQSPAAAVRRSDRITRRTPWSGGRIDIATVLLAADEREALKIQPQRTFVGGDPQFSGRARIVDRPCEQQLAGRVQNARRQRHADGTAARVRLTVVQCGEGVTVGEHLDAQRPGGSTQQR